jgi:HPt (histidine-containing phosphotransfer) domain-containing protein
MQESESVETTQQAILEIISTFGTELYFELNQIFQVQMTELISDWEQVNANTSMKIISGQAHKIKSSARNVGAEQLASLLQKVEAEPQKILDKSFLIAVTEEWRRFEKTAKPLLRM